MSGLAPDMLQGRMWRREDIQWKDWTWRLLESKGQADADSWIVAGRVVGSLASGFAARRGRMPFGAWSLVSQARLGNLSRAERIYGINVWYTRWDVP